MKLKEQRLVLLNSVRAIRDERQCDSKKAFEILLDWLCVRLSLDEYKVSPVLSEELNNYLYETLNLTLLREETRDWLGEVAQEIGATNSNLLSALACEICIEEQGMDIQEGRILSVFEPKVGTGRMFIAGFKRLKKAVVYFGCESDLLLYRIALINIGLYNIPAYVLYTPCEDHTKIPPTSSQWGMANKWVPKVRTPKENN